MDFGDAVRAAKRGKKISRKGWNGKGMFVVYQKGYPDGIPCNANTAEAFGIKEGTLFKVNPYLMLHGADGVNSMWAPSVSDSISTDWGAV